jgi:hypothetical protein
MASPLEDNPSDLDERDEIAAALRADGHDPMDLGKDEQVLEGNAILHSWEDEPAADRGGRTDRQVALEWERLEDRAEERGIELTRPDLDGDLPEWLEGF